MEAIVFSVRLFFHNREVFAKISNFVSAPEEMHSSAVLSLLVVFCDVAVGVGESDQRDQSAP